MQKVGGIFVKKWGLPQEWLKLIACVTMLIDHVGAALLPQYIILRVIGRIAFPIYCFLLAEGVAYTKNPRRYGLRLGIGAVLSEIPFDLALFGAMTLRYQSVMITLLLGFVMAECMKRVKKEYCKILLTIPFAVAAEWLCTDYGAWGVGLIAMFVLTRNAPHKLVAQTVGMAAICCLMDSYVMTIWGLRVPIEMFALASMVLIALYSGQKLSRSRTLQWGFYLFYPVHLTVLWILCSL